MRTGDRAARHRAPISERTGSRVGAAEDGDEPEAAYDRSGLELFAAVMRPSTTFNEALATIG